MSVSFATTMTGSFLASPIERAVDTINVFASPMCYLTVNWLLWRSLLINSEPSLIILVVQKGDWIAVDFHISFKQNVSRCLLCCTSLLFWGFYAQVTVTIKNNNPVIRIVVCYVFDVCFIDLLISGILRPLHSMEKMASTKHKYQVW